VAAKFGGMLFPPFHGFDDFIKRNHRIVTARAILAQARALLAAITFFKEGTSTGLPPGRKSSSRLFWSAIEELPRPVGCAVPRVTALRSLPAPARIPPAASTPRKGGRRRNKHTDHTGSSMALWLPPEQPQSHWQLQYMHRQTTAGTAVGEATITP